MTYVRNNLAVAYSHSVNGVSAIHTDICASRPSATTPCCSRASSFPAAMVQPIRPRRRL
mgnify:CR=1 FL=1